MSYRGKAFVFPGTEDFGITPLEAMSAGAPVIAFRGGGVVESVTERTGIFFEPQVPEALMEAVQKLEREEVKFDENESRAGDANSAEKNSNPKFSRNFGRPGGPPARIRH